MSAANPSNALLPPSVDPDTTNTASTAGQVTAVESSNAPPPPSVDADMTNTASTAGQETAADAEASQPPNNGGTSESEAVKPYSPDEAKREILRILSWPKWAHYEFLEIRETATTTEIKKAWRQKSLLTHTDHNNDTDAKDVFE
ncbi:hypothetical protein N0V95_010132, partial [Ascochyta clinopodiicola]